jgi:Bacterial SH3 domain
MKKIIATIVGLTATLGLGSTVLAADISTLKSGTYFAQGSMFARSYRVFRMEDDGRACVKIVDGPPNPYEGYQNITVSTIMDASPKLVVRATQDEFIVRGPQEFVIGDGRSGVWQLAKNFDGNLSAGLSDCLTAPGQYTKQFRGPFITGRIEPNVPGEIVTQRPKARVNMRSAPGEKSAIAHFGLGGDKVMLLASGRDVAEQMWYQVKFVGSGAEGWVRGDFVSAPGRSSIPAFAPVPKPANPDAKTDAFLIVPGQSVGKITKQTDRPGLVTIFGAANVEDFIEQGPEGIGEAPATRVKIGGKQSLRVIWKDDTRKQIASIAIYDARWHLADGLAVDMTVAALQERFGKFEFYGFGWDYGGTVISENNPKLDKYRKSTGVNFMLGVPSGRCQQFQADCRSVSGDSTFGSDNPRLKSLMPRIEVLYVRL